MNNSDYQDLLDRVDRLEQALRLTIKSQRNAIAAMQIVVKRQEQGCDRLCNTKLA